MRFLAMHAPFQSIRVAMYRKAGVKIGRPLVFGSHIFIDITSRAFPKYGVTIGDDVILAGYIYILTHSNILYGIKGGEDGPVTIKRGARIGINVTILPRVTIGENAVIGACSLVNRDIPDNCIAVGVPARPIKMHNFRVQDIRKWLQDISASSDK
jgi:acetyltransferase-like isoleucine patch superfamily enzyme